MMRPAGSDGPTPGQRAASWLLATVAALTAVLALWTLKPQADMSMNMLGYRSHCPFAPISTLALAIPAGGLWHMSRLVARGEWRDD